MLFVYLPNIVLGNHFNVPNCDVMCERHLQVSWIITWRRVGLKVDSCAEIMTDYLKIAFKLQASVLDDRTIQNVNN